MFIDCIEVMSCSDNVVRAGFTGKFKDVDTLTNILNFESTKGSPLFHSIEVNKVSLLFYIHCMLYTSHNSLCLIPTLNRNHDPNSNPKELDTLKKLLTFKLVSIMI